jgi:hypothetical protein
MPRKRKDEEPPAGDEEPREGEEGYGDDEPKQPPRRRKPKLGNPDADPVKIHRDYVERRVGGGGPATPEAYQRALDQWHELPGAVSRPPTEIRGPDAERPPDEGESAQEEDDSTEDEEPS